VLGDKVVTYSLEALGRERVDVGGDVRHGRERFDVIRKRGV
jgi:hypothetical protein